MFRSQAPSSPGQRGDEGKHPAQYFRQCVIFIRDNDIVTGGGSGLCLCSRLNVVCCFSAALFFTESATAQETAKSVDETRTESSEDLEDGSRQRQIKREPEEANNASHEQQPLSQQTAMQGLAGLQGGPGSPVMQLPTEELKKKGEHSTHNGYSPSVLH